MVARQAHGFDYERKVITRHGMIPADSYTAQWDAACDDAPVSIKTKKLEGAVEMGSFRRAMGIVDDFILCVGFWEGSKNNIVKESSLLIPGELWAEQFPDPDLNSRVFHVFDGITNSREDDALWTERRIRLQTEWNKLGSIIHLNPKRDHKNQMRMQCSITPAGFAMLESVCVDPFA